MSIQNTGVVPSTSDDINITTSDARYILKYSTNEQTINGNLVLSNLNNKASCFMVGSYGITTLTGTITYNSTLTNSNYGLTINLTTGVAVVSRAGYYLITFQSFSDNIDSSAEVYIRKNNSVNLNHMIGQKGGNTTHYEGGFNMSVIEKLEVNDDIRVVCTVGAMHGGAASYFCMSLIF